MQMDIARIVVPAFFTYIHPRSHMCTAVPLRVGQRYGGSSITKGRLGPTSRSLLNSRAMSRASSTPSA